MAVFEGISNSTAENILNRPKRDSAAQDSSMP